MLPYKTFIILVSTISLMSCNENKKEPATAPAKGTYGYDANFLKEHLKHSIELKNDAGARVFVTADYQARVMTSTAGGDTGNSYGWLNYDLITKNEMKPGFNAFGGEERFWIGPEGGQFSFYFKKGDEFKITNWLVPAFIDTEAYKIAQSDSSSVEFTHEAITTNYSGTEFKVGINRKISLLDKLALTATLGADIPASLQWVAYQSENNIKNNGTDAWKKETGLLSVWLLGMFTPTEETVAIVPFKPQADAKKYITDNYFGQIPADRLIIKDSVMFLRCDGKHRSKLGVSPVIAKPVAASFDFKKNILTMIIFNVDTGGDYVNSKWEIQKEPYRGDAVNAYNDGPLDTGGQLGPFYELESSSAAKALQPGESLQYKQVTCHFEGDFATLNALAKQLLGVSLQDAKMR